MKAVPTSPRDRLNFYAFQAAKLKRAGAPAPLVRACLIRVKEAKEQLNKANR